MQASDYFKGYDVNQSQITKQPTQRALEYERAYNKDAKERIAGFYNRLKSALGFKAAVQPRPRIAEYEKAYAAQEPAQDIEIVKGSHTGYHDNLKQLLAKAAGNRIGDITYTPSQCWLNHLEVDPDQRKKGAGAKLFKSAVGQMKDCEEIRWKATSDSVNFYRKQGAQRDAFQRTGNYYNMKLDRTGGKASIKRNMLDRPW